MSLTETLTAALAARDEAASICPVNSPSWRGNRKTPCSLCGVTGREACPKVAGADHALMEVVRGIVKGGSNADPS